MQAVIDQFVKDLTAELNPKSEYERFLILEIARGSAQVAACASLEGPDADRFRARIRNEWQELWRELVDRMARRLPRTPEATARALKKILQGVEHILMHLRGLEGTVRAQGALDEPERQHLFDLLGIDGRLRRNPQLCPAGSDAASLLELIAKEIKKLEAKLQEELLGSDKWAQKCAIDGQDKSLPPDAETQRLRSDMARARRRMNDGRALLDWVRSGGSAASLLDPQTGQPLPVTAAARSMRAQARPRAGSPSPSQTAPAPAPTPDPEGPASAASPPHDPAAAPSDEEVARLDQEAFLIAGVLMAEAKERWAATQRQKAAPSTDGSGDQTTR
jgi:hypothetical protein